MTRNRSASSYRDVEDMPAAFLDAVEWMQDQLADLREQIGRVRADAEQTNARLNTVHSQLDRIDTRLTRQEHTTNVAIHLQRALDEARAIVEDIRQRQLATERDLATVMRDQDEHSERNADARAELQGRIDEVARLTVDLDSRTHVLDEAHRHVQDRLSALRQEVDELATTVATTQNRQGTVGEAIHRLDASHALLDSRSSSLQSSLEVLTERVQSAMEQARRVDLRIDTAVLPGLAAIDEIVEAIELVRAERSRIESAQQTASQRIDRVEEALAGQSSATARLDARANSFEERLSQAQTELEEVRERVVQQVLRLIQTEERQKRREIDDLEREIRELKQYATRLAEE